MRSPPAAAKAEALGTFRGGDRELERYSEHERHISPVRGRRRRRPCPPPSRTRRHGPRWGRCRSRGGGRASRQRIADLHTGTSRSVNVPRERSRIAFCRVRSHSPEMVDTARSTTRDGAALFGVHLTCVLLTERRPGVAPEVQCLTMRAGLDISEKGGVDLRVRGSVEGLDGTLYTSWKVAATGHASWRAPRASNQASRLASSVDNSSASLSCTVKSRTEATPSNESGSCPMTRANTC